MKTRNLLVAGAVVLVAGVFSACGGGGNGTEAEAEAASLPTDGILGELPKVVAEYEAAEAAAEAQYEELKQSDPEKAKEFWRDYIAQGNTTKFKKETLPAVEKTLEGKEIPGEVAEGLPIKLEKNFTLDDKRDASTTGVFVAGASNETLIINYYPVAFDADGNAISVGRNISFSDYPIKEGKTFRVSIHMSVKGKNAAQWARLAKIVIMDKTSETYKQIEAQMKGE
ncbi:MAG: hypothetical protein IJP75_06330 [Bacteroidaceae bacterium]|nr:hypothetical protein [Bacteroidaceae bacterium]